MSNDNTNPEYPGTISYFNRDWLYPLESANSENFIARIDYDEDDLPCSFLWGVFEIHGDTANAIYMSFEFSDEHSKNLSLAALDKLTTALSDFRKALVNAYEQNESAAQNA